MKLINDDCMVYMSSLPDSSIDLIYTDPPYDLEHFKPGTGGTVNNIMKLDQTLVPINEITDTQYDPYAFSTEAIRIMKGINIYIWCNLKQIPIYIDIFVNQHKCKFNLLTWCKTNALPTYYNKYLNDCEYCLYFHKDAPTLKPKTYNDAKQVYIGPINRDNKIYNHPNIKPLPFVKSMLSNTVRPGFTVLDPYMGTGTTGVACKYLENIEFIGIECSKNHFETACNRIAAPIQKTLFTL